MSSLHVNQHFNPDICYNILSNVGVKPEDIYFLWACRAISQSFKDAAERVFIQKHLPKMDLTMNLGMSYSAKHGKVHLGMDFEFSHLLPDDRSRAVFVDNQCAPEFLPMVTKRLNSEMKYGNQPHLQKILVHLRHQLNDTWIPGLELDAQKLEITCDWMGMVSEFLKEQVELKRRRGDWVKSMEATMLDMRDRMERGELSMEDGLKLAFDRYAGNENAILKQVRRERIRRNVWLVDGVKWTNDDINLVEEKAALQTLKDANFAEGMAEPYSDEEEEAEAEARDGGREEEEMDEDEADDEDEEGDEEDEEDEDADQDEEEDEDEEGVDEDDEAQSEGEAKAEPAPEHVEVHRSAVGQGS